MAEKHPACELKAPQKLQNLLSREEKFLSPKEIADRLGLNKAIVLNTALGQTSQKR